MVVRSYILIPALMSRYPSSCSFPRHGVLSSQSCARFRMLAIVLETCISKSSNFLFSSALFIQRHPSRFLHCPTGPSFLIPHPTRFWR